MSTLGGISGGMFYSGRVQGRNHPERRGSMLARYFDTARRVCAGRRLHTVWFQGTHWRQGRQGR